MTITITIINIIIIVVVTNKIKATASPSAAVISMNVPDPRSKLASVCPKPWFTRARLDPRPRNPEPRPETAPRSHEDVSRSLGSAGACATSCAELADASQARLGLHGSGTLVLTHKSRTLCTGSTGSCKRLFCRVLGFEQGGQVLKYSSVGPKGIAWFPSYISS